MLLKSPLFTILPNTCHIQYIPDKVFSNPMEVHCTVHYRDFEEIFPYCTLFYRTYNMLTQRTPVLSPTTDCRNERRENLHFLPTFPLQPLTK